MQFQLEFQHRLRSSRRLVFENIMDLEHVPVVHRRWFSGIRVREQRSDYVEYRLVGNFFGLKQDVLARGGPLDSNRYWYEFITPLMTARVDGLLEGQDGDLTQTERITFNSPTVLAPLFWFLKPLLVLQKQDILECDTKLLEREYELEQTGFQRQERATPKIVVYGGNGFFGKLVVEELLRQTHADIIIASRTGRLLEFGADEVRVKFAQSDLTDYASVLRTVEGASIAILCAGPFQRMPQSLLRACIEKRVHYIDIADDRAFVEAAHEQASAIEAAGIAAFVGCSVVPGLTSLLTQFSRAELGDIDKVEIAISPGTRHPRGPGSFECLLATTGRPLETSAAKATPFSGWSDPRRVQFPQPMGWRTVYRVVDIADHFVQPHYFGTSAVEFRIGSELQSLNWLLSCIAALRRKVRVAPKVLIAPSRLIVGLAALFGTSQGGVWIRLEAAGNRGHRSEWSVWAAERGEIIPAILPSIAAGMLLEGEIHYRGIVPPEWISREQLIAQFGMRGVNVATRAADTEDWRHLTCCLRD